MSVKDSNDMISVINWLKKYKHKLWGTNHKLLEAYWKLLEVKRNEAIRRHGFEALKKFHQICIDNNILYWLYAGTLLGMVRDKRFIYSDTDIDIGVWDSPDIIIKLNDILPAHGYKKLYEFSVEGHILEQRFEFNGVGIDICYFRKEDNFSYACAFNKSSKGGNLYLVHDRYKSSAFDKSQTIYIDGIALVIPVDYDHILEQLYGDWQTPITKEDGYVMFNRPNQVHHYEIEAQITLYAESVHK